MNLRLLAASFLVLAAAGCATATPYHPADRAGGEGYSDQRIESNRYRIHFSGNSMTQKQMVENYLLYRAAELTLANGFDYFVTTDKSTNVDTRYEQTISGGFGYYWFPRMGLGLSTSYPVSEYDAEAEIVMFKGKKPENDPKAFDAHEVKANLESGVVRPAPQQ